MKKIKIIKSRPLKEVDDEVVDQALTNDKPEELTYESNPLEFILQKYPSLTETLVELLTEKDVLQKRHIAGTGTITARGIVGPIGGINEKIMSARKVGATVFFAPVDNADEISNVPDGIKVVTVATLAQAISYLERSKG